MVDGGFKRLRKLTLRLHVLHEQPSSLSHLGAMGLRKSTGKAIRDLFMVVGVARYFAT